MHPFNPALHSFKDFVYDWLPEFEVQVVNGKVIVGRYFDAEDVESGAACEQIVSMLKDNPVYAALQRDTQNKLDEYSDFIYNCRQVYNFLNKE